MREIIASRNNSPRWDEGHHWKLYIPVISKCAFAEGRRLTVNSGGMRGLGMVLGKVVRWGPLGMVLGKLLARDQFVLPRCAWVSDSSLNRVLYSGGFCWGVTSCLWWYFWVYSCSSVSMRLPLLACGIWPHTGNNVSSSSCQQGQTHVRWPGGVETLRRK
jgi:hypothetical protein